MLGLLGLLALAVVVCAVVPALVTIVLTGVMLVFALYGALLVLGLFGLPLWAILCGCVVFWFFAAARS